MHCKVRFTRRALCAVLLTHNPAQARWFGYYYVVIKEKEHRLGTLFSLMAPPVGLEPTTLRLTAACSTD